MKTVKLASTHGQSYSDQLCLFILLMQARKRAFVLADRTCCHHNGKLQGEEHETAQEHRQARKLPIHTPTVSGCNRGQ